MANEKEVAYRFDDIDGNMAGKVLKKLTAYMRPYWFWIILALAATFGSSIISIIVPQRIRRMVDYIQESVFGSASIDMAVIWNIAIVLIVLYVGVAMLDFISSFTMADISQILSERLRKDMNGKIDRVPLAHLDSKSTGDTLSRITNDVGTLGSTVDQSFIAIAGSTFMLLGSLIMMFIVNWVLALTAVVAAIVGFGFMATIARKTQKFFKAQQDELGKLTGHIEEVFSAHDVVKTNGAKDLMKKQLTDINGRLYDASFKAQFAMSALMSTMMFLSNLSFVFISVVGSVLAFSGHITFGVIVEFMIYIRLFTHPLRDLGQQSMTLQTGFAASHRIFEFLDADEMEDESYKNATINDVKGKVVFDDVKFSYQPDKLIIKNFSATIDVGRKVAIVGPTGAGKTTIVNLLMRFYELNSGSILIDDVDITTMKREDVYDLFCMVLQDTWLFEGSVKENIIYNKKDVAEEDVKRVCKAVGLHHYIRSLPQGYETILTEKVSFSTGQRQLMTIARAMITDAPLLILDEATSSVDTRTEIMIQKAMDKLMIGRTSFVIAHRLSTIRNADIILVMNEGGIVEMGGHDELLEAAGLYSRLYRSQFDFEEEIAYL